jgi:ABC-type branched-subunit amino acid transport system ATPase component
MTLTLDPQTERAFEAAAKARGMAPQAALIEAVTNWTQSTGAATTANGTDGTQSKATGLSRLARVRAFQEKLSPLARQPFSAADLIEEVRAGRMHDLEQSLGA